MSEITPDPRAVAASTVDSKPPTTIEDGIAVLRGLDLDGNPLNAEEAKNNLRKYGAISPCQRYTTMMPAIALEDLATDWNIGVNVLRAWATHQDWEGLRKTYLETVPLEMGGRLATGDFVVLKDQYLRRSVGDAMAIQDATMRRIAMREEQQTGKDQVFDLKKTSDAHLKDVQAYQIADGIIRTALGLPSKFSATYQHSVSERTQVKHTTTHEPKRMDRRTINAERVTPSLEIETTTTRELVLESDDQ